MHDLVLKRFRSMDFLFRTVGILMIVVSSFYLWNSVYHLFNYENTASLNEGVFGHGRSFFEVAAVFLFWLLSFIGGIGVYINRRTGLVMVL